MNVTDVDDKTIRGSRAEGVPLKEFTERYERAFLADLDALNILRPMKLTRATEHIPHMVRMIETLLESGYAYRADDGVYFDISKSEGYGMLAGLEKRTRTRSRVKNDEYDKEHAEDFALWKFHTEADGDAAWDAPFGRGRPGWHIECSAMSIETLGVPVDIHTGATDLIFPHHTNEIAQSEGATGVRPFVRFWLHGGFLNMEAKRMGKSIGNFLTLSELARKGIPQIGRASCRERV